MPVLTPAALAELGRLWAARSAALARAAGPWPPAPPLSAADAPRLAADRAADRADDAWVAAALTHAPALVAEVRRLREEVARLRAALEVAAGSIAAARQKWADAPCSAESHLDEGQTVIGYVGVEAAVRYSPAAAELRARYAREVHGGELPPVSRRSDGI